MSTLREIQQRMGNAVMHPLTANDQAPRRLKSEAEAIIKRNDRLSSLERLEIYSRSYWFRVLDSLVEDFPGVRAIVGCVSSTRCRAITCWRIRHDPSPCAISVRISWSGWTRTVSESRPYEHLALDMARLEWAQMEAFDGAQKRSSRPRSGRGRGRRGLKLQPYIRLVACRYAVDDLLLEIQEARRFELRRSQTGVASGCCRSARGMFHRGASRRLLRLLSAGGAGSISAAAALQAGNSLGDALEVAFAGSAVPQERWPALVQEWFSLWMNLGWFSA